MQEKLDKNELSNGNLLMVGQSGSGKTRYLINRINETPSVKYVVIVSKSVGIDDEYTLLNKPKLLFPEIPDDFEAKIKSYQEQKKKKMGAFPRMVLLLDDCIGLMDTKARKTAVESLVVTCRKYKIWFWGCVQRSNKLPTTFRDNISEVCLTSIVSQSDLENVYDYISQYFPSKKEFLNFYREHCSAADHTVFRFGVNFQMIELA